MVSEATIRQTSQLAAQSGAASIMALTSANEKLPSPMRGMGSHLARSHQESLLGQRSILRCWKYSIEWKRRTPRGAKVRRMRACTMPCSSCIRNPSPNPQQTRLHRRRHVIASTHRINTANHSFTAVSTPSYHHEDLHEHCRLRAPRRCSSSRTMRCLRRCNTLMRGMWPMSLETPSI